MTLYGKYCVAVLALLIMGGSPTFGQKYDPTGKRALDGKLLDSPDYLPFTQLTLELSIPKKRFLQLEPIWFTTTLSNKTNRSIVGHGGISFDYGALELVQGPGKDPQQIPTLTWRTSDLMVSPWVMEPGTRHSSSEMFYVTLSEVFPQPGLYHLYSVLYDLKGESFIQSKPVLVHIHAPEGINRLAFDEILKNHPDDPSTFWHPTHLRENHQDFLLLFPDSAYAPYVALPYGRLNVKRKNYNHAIDLLNIAAKHPDFVRADEVLENLRRAHLGLGHTAQAQQYVDQINTRFPNSKYADHE